MSKGDKTFIINEKLIKYDSRNSKLIFETKTLKIVEERDCCAVIYLSNSEEFKKLEGTFIDRIEIRSTKDCDFFWMFDKKGDVIFQEPFYESNNGYYSPATRILLYFNEIDNKINELNKQLEKLYDERKKIYSIIKKQIDDVDYKISTTRDKIKKIAGIIIDELEEVNGKMEAYYD